MIRIKGLVRIVVLVFFLSSCAPIAASPQLEVTPNAGLQTLTSLQETIGSDNMETLYPSTSSPMPEFSEPGPYFVGKRAYTIIDHEHNDREIRLFVWYPALKQIGANGLEIVRDAMPDMGGAPYPLILAERQSGAVIFKEHLASHGFVMASITVAGEYEEGWDINIVDAPRDFIYTIDHIASGSLDGLEGVVDFEHTGVSGFSYGGDISMTLGGARINPDYYLSFCENPPAIESKYGVEGWYITFNCNLSNKWESFASYLGEEMTDSEDGLWQAVTDERIKAVMPMAPSGAWFYGEKGLAAVNRPLLLIAATEDQYSPYLIETRFIYENIGSIEKSMISFVGENHDMPFNFNARQLMNHFAVAFFGYYLQGHEDYKQYFSEDYVKQFDNLAWGFYEGE